MKITLPQNIVVMHSVASVCMCHCVCVLSVFFPVCAVMFGSLDPETSLLVRRYIFGISVSGASAKIIESRSRSQGQ